MTDRSGMNRAALVTVAAVLVAGGGATPAQEVTPRHAPSPQPAVNAVTPPPAAETAASGKPRDLTPVTWLQAADHPPVELVRDGRAVAVVHVVDPKAREAFDWRRYLNPPHPPRTPPALLLLVHELRDAIREATGATLELVAEPPPTGQPAIVIGDCAESRAAGIDAAALPPEGFVVRSAADRIYLVGGTRQLSAGRPADGTAWAVADFLERFVGVRWYWPVELGGRSVPKTRSLAVRPTHYRDQPVLRLRQQGNGGGLSLMPLHYEGHNAMDRMPLPLPPGVAPADGRPLTDTYFNPLLRHGDSCDFQPGLVQGSWGGFAISREPTDPLRSEAVFLRKEDGTRDTRWNCLTAPETLDAYVATLERIWDSGRPVRFSHNIIAENSCAVYVPRTRCFCDRCLATVAKGGPTAAASQFAQRLATVVKDRWPGRIVVLQPRDGACPEGFTAPDNLVVANAYPEGFSLGWALHPSGGGTGGAALKLVLIPPGEFLMGSPADGWAFHPDEGPRHKVRITKPFYMGIHEVTRAQYASLMTPGSDVANGSRPMVNVSWNEAVEFCGRLGRLTRRTVRLPTEAEWEHACRAGTTTAWFFGDPDKVAELAEYAWYVGRPAGRHLVDMTNDVGGKKPNPWGLYDMYGNVAEWCADRFAPHFHAWSPVDDPAGPEAGVFRVIRGGSALDLLFAANPELARSARRTYAHPDARGPEQHGSRSEVGFRVIVEAGEPDR